MAAGLIRKESQQVGSRSLQIILIRQNDHGSGADKAAVLLQGVEIQRNIGFAGRQYAAGGPAGQIGQEPMPFGHATAVFLDQFIEGDASGCDVHTGPSNPS